MEEHRDSFQNYFNAQGGEAQNIRGSAVCCLRTKQHDTRGYLGGQEPKYQSIVEAISVKLEMWKYEDELSPRFAGNAVRHFITFELSYHLTIIV